MKDNQRVWRRSWIICIFLFFFQFTCISKTDKYFRLKFCFICYFLFKWTTVLNWAKLRLSTCCPTHIAQILYLKYPLKIGFWKRYFWSAKFHFTLKCSRKFLHSYQYPHILEWLPNQWQTHMSRDMWFQTMWHFDKCRLRQACAASF